MLKNLILSTILILGFAITPAIASECYDKEAVQTNVISNVPDATIVRELTAEEITSLLIFTGVSGPASEYVSGALVFVSPSHPGKYYIVVFDKGGCAALDGTIDESLYLAWSETQ